MPDDEIIQHRCVTLLELIQRHTRRRDLMGLVEQMTCLLNSGYVSDRQIKGLFNYILQAGGAVYFDDLIDSVAEYSPKHRGNLMIIAKGLRQEEFQKGIHTNALNTAKTMLDAGASLEDVL